MGYKGIPSTKGIKDQQVRAVLDAICREIREIRGVDGNPDDQMISRGQGLAAGFVGLDRGILVKKPNDVVPDLSGSSRSILAGTATFDATAGKAVGTHSLGVSLPANAIIRSAWYSVSTTFTSAADLATIQLGIATDDPAGLVAAIAINDASLPWNSGSHAGIPDGSNSSTFTTKTTASRLLQAIVGVENLTAGVLQLFYEYEVIA